MRLVTRALVAALFIALVGAGGAHAESSHWVGLHGNAALPTGDLKQSAITSWGGGASYTYLWNDVVGLGGGIDFYRWRVTDEYDAFIESTFGVGTRVKFNDFHYTLRAILMAPLPGPVKPFAYAGTGAFNEKNRVEAPYGQGEVADNHHGWTAGGGARIDLTPALALTAQAGRVEYSSDHFTTTFTSVQAGLDWRMSWGRPRD
jgi:opacity protein-like surface antigen